jgi:hypothetical protein
MSVALTVATATTGTSPRPLAHDFAWATPYPAPTFASASSVGGALAPSPASAASHTGMNPFGWRRTAGSC